MDARAKHAAHHQRRDGDQVLFLLIVFTKQSGRLFLVNSLSAKRLNSGHRAGGPPAVPALDGVDKSARNLRRLTPGICR
jgi:hypothetical protein